MPVSGGRGQKPEERPTTASRKLSPSDYEQCQQAERERTAALTSSARISSGPTSAREATSHRPSKAVCEAGRVSPSASGPELKARAQIDAALGAAGWIVQDREAMNLSAGRGVAVREFKLTSGHGFADYLLFVAGKAVGVLEAKPEGHT